MEDDLKELRWGCYLSASVFVGMILLALFCMCLASCGTTKRIETRVEVPVEVKQEVHDTLIMTKYVNIRDSVYVRDSISTNALGGIDRWHTQHIYTSKGTADTVYINRDVYKDKPVYITKTKEVVKAQSFWEKVQDLAWAMVAVAVVGAVVGRAVRKRKQGR